MRAKNFIDAVSKSTDEIVPKDYIFSALFYTVSTKISNSVASGH